MRYRSAVCQSTRRKRARRSCLFLAFLLNTGIVSSFLPGAGAQDTRSVFHARKGFRATLDAASGVCIATYQTPEGKILVYLPPDLHPSESVVGTMRLQPKGKEEAERTTNRAALAAYHLVWNAQNHPVQETPLTWTLPAETRPDTNTLILEDAQDRSLAQTELPIVASPIAANSSKTASPSDNPPSGGATNGKFILPKRGDIGRPLVLQGNVGADALMYQAQVGDKPARLLAASSRLLIVESPEGTPGKTTLQVKKDDQVLAESAFRNDRVSHGGSPWPYIIGGGVLLGIAALVFADRLRHDVNSSLSHTQFPVFQ